MSPLPEGVLPVDATELGDDAGALDMLARFALEAQRHGYRVAVRDASPRLRELIELAGLSATLGVEPLSPGPGSSRC